MDLLVSLFSKYLLFFLFLIPNIAGATLADESRPLNLDLSGPWRIQLGDDPSWAGATFPDDAWDTISLPGNIVGYSIKKTGQHIGIVWLRKMVFIPADWADRDIGISLGQISNADETFFNGERIGTEGSFPPDEMSMWNITRHYLIQKNLVKPGALNVISIRIWFHTFGGISGDFYLSDYTYWQKERAWGIFSRIIFNYIIIAMGIPLFVIFLLFYFQQPQSKEYLFYCLQLLCGLIIILDLCSLWRFPGEIENRIKSIGFSWISMNVVHPIFLHHLYTLKRKKIEYFLLFCFLVSLPFILFIKETELRILVLMCVFFGGLTGIYDISCHITALVQNKPYARIFSLFGIMVIIGAFHDGLQHTANLAFFEPAILNSTKGYMLFPLSAFSLYMGTAIILVLRLTGLVKANEDLNENLENKVSERTTSLILLTEELEKKHIQLTDMAIRDSLTGLYNHAAFCERLDEIFMTSKKNKAPLSVSMIDVDNFKGFNDTYGHQVGDQVLIRISDVLRKGIREYNLQEKSLHHKTDDNRHYDLAGRYGGDEFMVALPQCGRKAAINAMERICSEINRIQIESHPDIRVSGSFGIAHYHPRVKCLSSDKLIMLADTALYKAKSMGKNRVCLKVYENQ